MIRVWYQAKHLISENANVLGATEILFRLTRATLEEEGRGGGEGFALLLSHSLRNERSYR